MEICIKSFSRYHIDAFVQDGEGMEWRLTGMYGEPKGEEKHKTWRLMKILNNQYNKPWLCLGDFNEILFGSEKEGGQPRSAGCMDRFRNVLEDYKLEDLGFCGRCFYMEKPSSQCQGIY